MAIYTYSTALSDDLLEDLSFKYEDVLEYLEAYLNDKQITYNENDLVIDIDHAYKAICNYTDYNSSNFNPDYTIPLIKLSLIYFQNGQIQKSIISGDKQITQYTEGSRSVTYKSSVMEIDSDGLTSEIRVMLPKPGIRIFR